MGLWVSYVFISLSCCLCLCCSFAFLSWNQRSKSSPPLSSVLQLHYLDVNLPLCHYHVYSVCLLPSHTWFSVVGSMQVGILNPYCGQQMAIYIYFYYIPHPSSVFSPLLKIFLPSGHEKHHDFSSSHSKIMSHHVYFVTFMRLVSSADSETD